MTTTVPVTVDVEGPAGAGRVFGDLVVPQAAHGLVLFAHGSGSSRHSPRNRAVAARLHDGGLATLLLDLLTETEEALDARTGELRFDIPFLGRRVVAALDRTADLAETAGLARGLFGASTGAAAALLAAAERPDDVAAVVSRGGRPDLAEPYLTRVRAPSLFIVGERDVPVLDLNRRALRALAAPGRLEIVPGATHLFEEPGALERVAELAAEWFDAHLAR